MGSASCLFVGLIAILGLFTSGARADHLLVAGQWGGIGSDPGVFKVSLDGSTWQKLSLPFRNEPYSLAYDKARDRIYWATYKSGKHFIASAQSDGSDSTTHTNHTGYPYGFDFDEESNAIYYADWNLNFLVTHDVVTGQETKSPQHKKVSDVIFDDVNRQVYYLESWPSARKVWRAEADWSSPEVLADLSNMGSLRGAALSPNGDALYICAETGQLPDYTAHYLRYDLTTGELTEQGTSDEVICTGLATDGYNLYIETYRPSGIWVAPVGDPTSATALPGLPRKVGVMDVLFIKQQEGEMGIAAAVDETTTTTIPATTTTTGTPSVDPLMMSWRQVKRHCRSTMTCPPTHKGYPHSPRRQDNPCYCKERRTRLG